jgi:hypothetical protein
LLRKEIFRTRLLLRAGILKPVREIPVAEIESSMNEKYRELKVVEAYMSIDGTLHIYADQRNPIMRVMANNGGDYYVDDDGVVVRRRNLYTPRLHIVGGNVNISQAMLNGVSVLDTSIKNSILKDIFRLVSYINNDNFGRHRSIRFVDSQMKLTSLGWVKLVHLKAETLKGT